MNKTHRVIWSDALHTFVVASEHASARGKPSSTRKLLATAVALGMGGLMASPAMAAGSCPSGGLNTLGKPTSVMCSLAQGATLNVTAKGAITVSGPAVLLGPTATTATSGVANDASLIRNGGQLTGTNGGYGILLEQTAVSGLIDNAAGGVIRSDSGAGIRLRDSTLDGSVRNLGRIQAPTGTGIQVVDSQVAGNLDNRNAIAAQVGIGVQNSTVQGSILDRGNIGSNAYAIDVGQSTIGGSIGVLGSASGGQGALRVSDSSVAGTVTNSGSLWSQKTAVLLDNTLVKGNLGNSGTIAGSIGLKVNEGGFRSLSNSGRIEGNDFAVQIAQAQVTGGIVNSGTLAIVAPNYANAPYPNIGTALDVQLSRVAKDIVNSGSISGGSLGGSGVEIGGSTLGAGLRNSGSIAGHGNGVHLYSSNLKGSIVNDGVISAGDSGAALRLSTVEVKRDLVNNGSLDGGTGLRLDRGLLRGDLSNTGAIQGRTSTGMLLNRTDVDGGLRNSGTLVGAAGGLVLNDSRVAAGIDNSGKIDGGDALLSDTDGVRLNKTSLRGDLSNSGSISGRYSINLQNSTLSGNLLNSGTLSSYLSGIQLSDSRLVGNLVNQSTGQLFGLSGITLNNSTLTGRIVNQGQINSGFLGLSIANSMVAGGLTNSGSLSSGAFSNIISGSSIGDIVNTGSIQGADYGLTLDTSTVQGTIDNKGQINGLLLNTANVNGAIQNSGALTGPHGLTLNTSTVGGSIVNSGDISGVGLTGSTVKGIDNSGVIHNAAVSTTFDPAVGKGLQLIDSTVQSGGIRNSNELSGTAGGLDLVNSTVNGGIVNTGSMSADVVVSSGNDGLSVQKSTLSGGIVNSGTLFGNSGLIFSESTLVGNIENSGKVSGAYFDGLRLSSSRLEGDLINSASGTIVGPNSLTINGSTITGQLINAGTLDGTGRRLSPGAALLVTDSVIGGDIINSGTLNGTISGVNNSTIGGFVNSGTITNAYGLSFDNATIAGDIVNSGTIVGNGMDISKSVIGGQLINSGTISGRYYALHSLDGSVTRMTIAGNNTAAFIGEVSLPGASVNLAKAATYTLRDGNLFTVKDFTNNGTLRIASDANATIDGNYAQASDAVLSTEALNASTFGKLKVTGTATLPDQARFNVDVVDSGQSFSGARLNDVLSAGILNSNGSYAVTSNSALFNFRGVKNDNSVDLVAAPKSATAVTQALQGSGNRSAARALDSGLASNGNLTPFFVGATNSAQVASAVSQTLPSNAVAATQVSQSTLSTITDVVRSRIDANTGLASGDGFYGDKNLWMKPFGSWINQSERGGSPGYDASVYGMAFGVDAPVNELLRLGVSFSYANADTNSKADVSSQSAKVDLYQLMGYGSYTVAPNTELSFHAGVGQNRNDGERNLNLNGIGGKASANYDSRSVTAGVALAKAFDISPTTRFIPSVRADYTWLQDDSYSEKGSAALQPLLLKVDKHQTDQLIVGLDGKLSHEIVPGTQVTGNLGVGYDVIHDDSMLTSTYAGAPGQSFNTVGQSSSPWLARGGVGVSTKIASNGTELSVNYDGEVRTDFTNQTVSLKVKMPF